MASRTAVADTDLSNVVITKGFKLGQLTVELVADNYVITADHPPMLYIDPAAAARDVLLPAISAATAGLTFIVFNTGTATETITFKDSADGALTPAPAIVGNEGIVLSNNGVAWRGAVGPNT